MAVVAIRACAGAAGMAILVSPVRLVSPAKRIGLLESEALAGAAWRPTSSSSRDSPAARGPRAFSRLPVRESGEKKHPNRWNTEHGTRNTHWHELFRPIP